MPILQIFINCFESMGFNGQVLDDIKANGVLAFEPYFYGILLDAARGDKHVVTNIVNNMNQSYVIDFLTSTSPCVVAQEIHGFKAEIYFPISSSFCIRFLAHSLAGNRNGKIYDVDEETVRTINTKVVAESFDIVMSKSKFISSYL